MKYQVQSREKLVRNTDPQRRCYNGCNFSEETWWTEWSPLYDLSTEEEAKESVESWTKMPRGTRVCEYRYVII